AATAARVRLMWRQWIPFWTPGASPHAGDVDLLLTGLLLISLSITGLLFLLLLTFAIRYRAGSAADRSDRIRKTWRWEVGWTAATFVAFLVLFGWARRFISTSTTRPSTRFPFTSSPSNGCGRRSIPAASARSTSFTFRCTGRCV